MDPMSIFAVISALGSLYGATQSGDPTQVTTDPLHPSLAPLRDFAAQLMYQRMANPNKFAPTNPYPNMPSAIDQLLPGMNPLMGRGPMGVAPAGGAGGGPFQPTMQGTPGAPASASLDSRHPNYSQIARVPGTNTQPGTAELLGLTGPSVLGGEPPKWESFDYAGKSGAMTGVRVTPYGNLTKPEYEALFATRDSFAGGPLPGGTTGYNPDISFLTGDPFSLPGWAGPWGMPFLPMQLNALQGMESVVANNPLVSNQMLQQALALGMGGMPFQGGGAGPGGRMPTQASRLFADLFGPAPTQFLAAGGVIDPMANTIVGENGPEVIPAGTNTVVPLNGPMVQASQQNPWEQYQLGTDLRGGQTWMGGDWADPYQAEIDWWNANPGTTDFTEGNRLGNAAAAEVNRRHMVMRSFQDHINAGFDPAAAWEAANQSNTLDTGYQMMQIKNQEPGVPMGGEGAPRPDPIPAFLPDVPVSPTGPDAILADKTVTDYAPATQLTGSTVTDYAPPIAQPVQSGQLPVVYNEPAANPTAPASLPAPTPGGLDVITEQMFQPLMDAFLQALQPASFDTTQMFQTGNEVFQNDLNSLLAQVREESARMGLQPGSTDRDRRLLSEGGRLASQHRLGQLELGRQSFESQQNRALQALGLAPSAAGVTEIPFQRQMQALPYLLQNEMFGQQLAFQAHEGAANRQVQTMGLLPQYRNIPLNELIMQYTLGEQARGVGDTQLQRQMSDFYTQQSAGLNQLLALLSGTPMQNTMYGPSPQTQTFDLLGALLGAGMMYNTMRPNTGG